MPTPNTTASIGDIDAISLLQESGLTPQQIADAIEKSKELSKTSTEINEALTKLDGVTKAQLDAAVDNPGFTVPGLTTTEMQLAVKKSSDTISTAAQIDNMVTNGATKAELNAAVLSGGGTVTSSGSFTKTFVVGDWVGTTTKTLTIPQTTHLLGVGYKDVTIFDATDIATTVGYSVDDTTGNVTLTTTGTAFAGSAFIVGGASAGGGTSLTTEQTAALSKAEVLVDTGLTDAELLASQLKAHELVGQDLATQADLDALVLESGSLTVAQSTKLTELANFEPFPTMWDKNATLYTELKTSVKSVKIYGTGMDLTRKFYLSFLRRNSYGTTRLEVKEVLSGSTPTVASITLTNPYVPSEDLTKIFLLPVKGSGINVEIKLLWSAIPDGYSKIAESYATTGFNSSVTFSEMSFSSLNSTNNEVASSKVIYEQIESRIASATATSNALIASTVSNAYSDKKELTITPLVDKAMVDILNYYNIPDTTLYKTTPLIEAYAGEMIYIECAVSGYSLGWSFDIKGNAIEKIPYNTNYLMPSGARYFAFSSTNTAIVSAKAYKINSLSTNAVNTIKARTSKTNVSGNLWTPDMLIPSSNIDRTNGKIFSSTDRSSTKFIEVTSGETYLLGSFSNLQSRNFVFYDADYNYVSGILKTGGELANFDLQYWYKLDSADSYFYKIVIPLNVKYIRFTFHASEIIFTTNVADFRIVNYKNYELLLNKVIKSSEKRDYDFLKKEVNIMTNTLVSILEKNVLVLGDSISANSLGYGGWVRQFNNLLRPKNLYRYAVGGKTLTEKSGLFGEALIFDGNAGFCAMLERAIKAYTDGTIEKPDILIVNGCTNDFTTDPLAYIDTALHGEHNSEAYANYVESEFFTNSNLTLYGNYVAKSLATIDISKIIGAVRYIVERALTYFPNIKIFFCTPIQSASHSLYKQRRCVQDMRFACERLNLPIIDQWAKAGTPMILDYPGDGSGKLWLPDGDGVHPFSASGNTLAAEKHGRFIVSEFIKNYPFDVSKQPS